MLRLLYTSCSLLLLCSSCISVRTPEYLDHVRFDLERSGCDTCPQYALTIFGNGSVKFVGKKNCYKQGTMWTKIPIDTVETIFHYFTTISFFQMDSLYELPPTPCEHIYLSYKRDTYIKSVTHASCSSNYPKSLSRLEQLMDSSVLVSQYTVFPPGARKVRVPRKQTN